MHTTDPEIINLTVLSFLGIWTLVRFLGTRGSPMSGRLLFTFAPHVAFSVAMVMASCSSDSQATEPEACNSRLEFSDYAEDLRRMANAKDMCGRLENYKDFAICTNQPPIALLELMDNCETVKRLDEALDEWLNVTIPPAKDACVQSSHCGSYIVNDHAVY